MKSRKLLLGCGIAVILVLGALAVAGILLATGVPEVEHQIPEGMRSNLVNITLPLNGADTTDRETCQCICTGIW